MSGIGEQEHPGRLNPLRRLAEPLTARRAAWIIVVATLLVTLAGGAGIWIIDHDEFPNLGTSMWWALQTVTTVGYGDVVPEQPGGRLIGAVLMLQGIGLITVVAAAVTATLIEQSRVRLGGGTPGTDPGIGEQLERIESRLSAIEHRIDAQEAGSGKAP